MLQDLRYARRVLMNNKGWTAMVVLLLALGIGANTTLFSAMNGILLRKLPVANPDSLVRFRYAGPNDMATNRTEYGYRAQENGVEIRTTFPYPMYQQFLKDNKTLTEIFAYAPMASANVVADGSAGIASAALASGNFYTGLGVKAAAGRTIMPADDRQEAAAVAVISSSYWNARFGSSLSVVGKAISVNNVPVTIVGVISPEFTGIHRPVDTPADIVLPLALLARDPQLSQVQRINRATYWWVEVMGRLMPGVTAAQVEGNLGGVFQQTARQSWNDYFTGLSPAERLNSLNQNRTHVPALRISSLAQGYLDPEPENLSAVRMLTIVVALILVIVCANVANLLLTRAAGRSREIAVRLSIGATRGRIIRQLFIENAVLALLGGAGALLVAFWGKDLLPAQNAAAPIDSNVLMFTFALAMATALIFGLAPALRATRANVSEGLKTGSRTFTSSRSISSKVLVVVQVSISFTLLIGSGLFLRTVRNLRNVDFGFNSNNVVVFRVNPQLNRYEAARIASLFDRMKERIRGVPGVSAVSFSNAALMSGYESDTNLLVDGRKDTIGLHNVIDQLTVDRDFFETMQIPIVQGRGFVATDKPDAARVAIINETAARKFFPNENPLGRHVGTSPETANEMEIVGVVADARYNRIRDAAPPTLYFSHAQRPNTIDSSITFEVRAAAEAGTVMPLVRQAVHDVDPDLPVFAMSTQAQQIDNRLAVERIFAQSYSLFGGLALLLASIGLFALMSYNVARRTTEIGIRLAIGAQPLDVLAMVLRESAVLVSAGLLIGLVTALAAGRSIASLLFGVAPTDLFTMSMALLVMVSICMFAAFLPARRASRVDPMVALRHE